MLQSRGREGAVSCRRLTPDRSTLLAARAKFVAFDPDGGLSRFAIHYPTEYLQLHSACVVQHGRPVHRQPHLLALLERLLGGEPDFATADFERFADSNGGDLATLHAFVADVLLNTR